MTVIEPDTVKGDLQNAIWWAIVTASTVGYGDISGNAWNESALQDIQQRLERIEAALNERARNEQEQKSRPVKTGGR